MALRADKLETRGAFFRDNFFDLVCNAVWILLFFGCFHPALQLNGFSLLGSVLLFDLKKLLFVESELVFEDSVNHLQAIFLIKRLFTKVLKMTLFNREVEISGSLMGLESENKLLFASVFASDTRVFLLFCLFPLGLFLFILLDPLCRLKLGNSDFHLLAFLLFKQDLTG